MEVLIILLLIIGVIFIYANHVESKKSAKTNELRGIDRFDMGKYVAGLAQWDEPTTGVDCVVTNDHFIFMAGIGRKMGQIPRDSVSQIIVDDKTKITQRLTVTRMLTLGVFSLAVPKKTKHIEYCVMIDWTDARGVRNNTVFEFTGDGANTDANKAANAINRYITAPSRTAAS